MSFSSGLQYFCREIHSHCSLINKALFFSCWFWDFFPLCLIFIGLIMLCLFIDFFEFILLGIYSSSWIYRFIYFTKLRKFSIIISSNIFLMSFFSFLPGLWRHNYQAFWYCPRGFWCSVLFVCFVGFLVNLFFYYLD